MVICFKYLFRFFRFLWWSLICCSLLMGLLRNGLSHNCKLTLTLVRLCRGLLPPLRDSVNLKLAPGSQDAKIKGTNHSCRIYAMGFPAHFLVYVLASQTDPSFR